MKIGLICPLFLLSFILILPSSAASGSDGIHIQTAHRTPPPPDRPNTPESRPLRFAEERGGDKEKRQDYDELEKDLQSLIKEFKRLEKDARDKIRKEILPLIQKEIEKLREWIREFELEEKKPKEKEEKGKDYQKT
jgi:hypothetical protein